MDSRWYQRLDPSCPCTKECKRRTPECRIDCGDYAKYASKKAEEYHIRAVRKEQRGMTQAAVSAARRVQLEKKRGRVK